MATPTLIIPGQTRSSSESGGATNLTFTRNATTVTVVSDTGTDAELPAATVSLAGIMSATQATATDKLINTPPGTLIGRGLGGTGPAQAFDVGDGLALSAGRLDVTAQMSVEVDEVGVRLVNDEATPGNSEYYGTSAAGVKGYHPLPSLGGATNLGFSQTTTTVTVTSSTGTSTIIPSATGSLAGMMSAASQSKLDGIAPGATANSPDATLLDRANHNGTQPPSSIAGSTTLGQALMTLANPSAIRFARINADNSVTLLDATGFREAIAACLEDDVRLSDARTPTAHTHPPTDIAGSTTLGRALMTATNPGAIAFLRVNADNSVTMLDAASFRTAIGAGAGTPAGSGTELQFRNGSTFGALTGSSVSGGNLTMAGSITGVSSSWSSFMNATEVIAFTVLNIGNKGTSNFASLRPNTSAPNHLIFGASDAAAPAAQTLSVQSASGSNVSAASAVWSMDGARGTGTGAGGDVRIRTAPAGASGSAQNGFVESLRVRAGRGIALSNGNIAAAGDCIGEVTVLRGNTSGTTPVILSESALGGGLPIPLNAVIQAIVLVQGISEAGDVARFARQVCAKNVAGTSSLVSSNVTIGADDSGTTSLAITVSDTNDTLDIQVTGTSGNNWRWNAVILAGELVRNNAG